LRRNFDKHWIGAIIGASIPLIFFLVIYLEEQIIDPYFVFLKKLYLNGLMSSLLRISLIGNLGVFLLTFNTGFTKLPRGILALTIVYGMFVVYMYLK